MYTATSAKENVLSGAFDKTFSKLYSDNATVIESQSKRYSEAVDEFVNLSVKNELKFIDNLALSERDSVIAQQIIKEIRSRLEFLSSVGLDYLTLARSAGSLSGGELKRIEIAMVNARGTELSVFDEPEAGIDLWSFNNLIKVFEKTKMF